MKRSATTRSLMFAAITALAVAFAPTATAADKGCSVHSLKGTFAFTGTGFIVAPIQLAGPVVEVGTQTFDGRGNTTYTAMLSQNGTIVPVTATGTYQVNPDCTGTMTVLVAPFGATLHLAFAISGAGLEFQAIETETGFVVTRIARRQFPDGDWRQ